MVVSMAIFKLVKSRMANTFEISSLAGVWVHEVNNPPVAASAISAFMEQSTPLSAKDNWIS